MCCFPTYTAAVKYSNLQDISNITPYNDKDKSKKGQVEEMFDNIAPQYDFLNHFLSLGIDKLWRKRAVKMIAATKARVILDVATGTGDLAVALAKLQPEKIIGYDLSELMLSVGRDKVKQKGLEKIISMQKGDSENMPFDNNTFDAVTVAFGVRNFENTQRGIDEMYRVLKPGGTLLVLEFSKPKFFPVKQVFYFYFHFILPVVGRFFSKDKRAYSYLPESVASFPEGTAFLAMLAQAGFKNRECRTLSFGISSIYTGQKP
ncbi:MAG: bifunctional demethylmenaquinone methyltransferase/2-methoxy-6-polyprenyl-1,4-benzoquinol methylase UbiE [Chitinophagales bacterium]|nr:bifunctional demethylmenaquinone methyltransferase/2-methoxy-6-polyprenyl-1,4-benzoquinol methylase UbiE [Chitinophagales bacterium]